MAIFKCHCGRYSNEASPPICPNVCPKPKWRKEGGLIIISWNDGRKVRSLSSISSLSFLSELFLVFFLMENCTKYKTVKSTKLYKVQKLTFWNRQSYRKEISASFVVLVTCTFPSYRLSVLLPTPPPVTLHHACLLGRIWWWHETNISCCQTHSSNKSGLGGFAFACAPDNFGSELADTVYLFMLVL